MDFSLRIAKPHVNQVPALVAFSDASHYRDRVDYSRIGMLVFARGELGLDLFLMRSTLPLTSFAA
jgi:hypothetical protein